MAQVFTVKDGSDALSGYEKNTYVLSGATTKSETEIGNNGTITIANEGETVKNVGYILNAKGKLNSYKNVKYGLVEYIYKYIGKHPKKVKTAY